MKGQHEVLHHRMRMSINSHLPWGGVQLGSAIAQCGMSQENFTNSNTEINEEEGLYIPPSKSTAHHQPVVHASTFRQLTGISQSVVGWFAEHGNYDRT